MASPCQTRVGVQRPAPLAALAACMVSMASRDSAYTLSRSLLSTSRAIIRQSLATERAGCGYRSPAAASGACTACTACLSSPSGCCEAPAARGSQLAVSLSRFVPGVGLSAGLLACQAQAMSGAYPRLGKIFSPTMEPGQLTFQACPTLGRMPSSDSEAWKVLFRLRRKYTEALCGSGGSVPPPSQTNGKPRLCFDATSSQPESPSMGISRWFHLSQSRRAVGASSRASTRGLSKEGIRGVSRPTGSIYAVTPSQGST